MPNGKQQLYHRLYGNCVECPRNLVAILISIACFIVLGYFLGRRLAKKKVDLGIFSIGEMFTYINKGTYVMNPSLL